MNFKRIYIEITNVCNLNCSFCPPLKRAKTFMSVENFEKILPRIEKYSPQIYLHVKGEPLMHPQLEEILSLVENHGIPVNITTNGTLLRKKGDMLLSHLGVRQVNISVHSFSEQQGDGHIGYLQDISGFGLEALKLGRPYVTYRMWNGERDEKIKPVALRQLEIIAGHFGMELNGEKIVKGRNSAKLGDNIYISFMEEFQWPSMDLPKVSAKGKCLGGRDMLAILADGTVVPCCLDAEGIVNLGNIFNQSLEEILSTEKYQNLHRGFRGGNISEGLCQRCSYRLRFDKKH